jgi:hypothetical protein
MENFRTEVLIRSVKHSMKYKNRTAPTVLDLCDQSMCPKLSVQVGMNALEELHYTQDIVRILIDSAPQYLSELIDLCEETLCMQRLDIDCNLASLHNDHVTNLSLKNTPKPVARYVYDSFAKMPQAQHVPHLERLCCGFWWKLSDDVVRTKNGSTVRRKYGHEHDHAYLVYVNDNRSPAELIGRFSDKSNGKVPDPPHEHRSRFRDCWLDRRGILPLRLCFLHREVVYEICTAAERTYEDMWNRHSAAEICKDEYQTLLRVRAAFESKTRDAGPTPRPRGTA